MRKNHLLQLRNKLHAMAVNGGCFAPFECSNAREYANREAFYYGKGALKNSHEYRRLLQTNKKKADFIRIVFIDLLIVSYK